MTALTDAPTRLPLGAGWGETEAWQYGPLRVLVTPEEDHAEEGRWRHVSVSCQDRLPTYEELGLIRERHFDPAATVLQVLPPREFWVNTHAFCLHLWQRLDQPLLPRGLYRTVGIPGSVPLDDHERALNRRGHTLAATLRNLLRAQGRLTVEDAAGRLEHVYTGSALEVRLEVRRQLAALAATDPRVGQGLELSTFLWRSP